MAKRAGKGSAWERKFAGLLSEWWTGEPDRRVFWRTSGSGATSTVRNRKGKKTRQHCGDICAVDPVGQPLLQLLVIEAKKGYSSVTMQDLIDNPEGGRKGANYRDWIAKAEADAEQAGVPHWMLVVKRDKREAVVVLPCSLICELEGQGCLGEKDHPELVFFPSQDSGSIHAMPLKAFFASVRPNDVRKLVRELRKEDA